MIVMNVSGSAKRERCGCGARAGVRMLLSTQVSYHFDQSGHRVANPLRHWLWRCKDHAKSDWRPRTRADRKALEDARRGV